MEEHILKELFDVRSIKKIVTHDTTFHADDVIAVEMLQMRRLAPAPVVRTRDPEELAASLSDPKVVVLDVGGQYDPELNNYDHHQDVSLPSAAGLIFRHFKDVICEGYAQPYFQEFIDGIDAIDTNRDNVYAIWRQLPVGFRNTSSLIGAFNRNPKNALMQMEYFKYACNFANSIITNELNAAKDKFLAMAEYDRRNVLPNNVAVFDEFNHIWKEKADHVWSVMPHATGWQLQSRDTTIVQVPESISELPGFVFRHKSGFMAVVKYRDVLLDFAKTLPKY